MIKATKYTIGDAQQDIEHLHDDNHALHKNNILLNEGLAMALRELRLLRSELKPDE